jgi:hypothetical protein
VLPSVVAKDAARLALFEREAKVLAALNHPNVTQIWAAKRTTGRTLGSNQGVGEAMNRKE